MACIFWLFAPSGEEAFNLLVRFLAKRTAVLIAIVAAAAFLIDGFQPTISLGVILGGALGIYKSRLTSLALAKAVEGTRFGRVAITQILANLLMLAFLTASALASMRLLAGAAAGLLLLPLFISINAATEWFGLTHNNWGEAAGGTQKG